MLWWWITFVKFLANEGVLSLIFRRNHCSGFPQLQILGRHFEAVSKSSSFVKWICVVVMTTTLRLHTYSRLGALQFYDLWQSSQCGGFQFHSRRQLAFQDICTGYTTTGYKLTSSSKSRKPIGRIISINLLSFSIFALSVNFQLTKILAMCWYTPCQG